MSYEDQLAEMIHGIAQNASHKLYSREVEDIEQDLWVKVLEAERTKGEKLDIPLAAKICWDAVEDMRRNDIHKSATPIDTTTLSDVETTNMEFLGSVSPVDNLESQVFVKDFCSRYPVGSKERLYLDFWGNASGAMPNNRALPPSHGSLGGYTETNLAHLLGYSGASNTGYRRFKDKMQKAVAEYFYNQRN